MHRAVSIGLLVLLSACGRTESKAGSGEGQPAKAGLAAEDESEAAPLSCREAVAALAKFVDDGGATDSLPSQLEGLCDDGPADLLGTYARLQRDERQAAPDPDTKKWVLEACPEFEAMKQRRGEAPVGERNEVFWSGCDLERFGVGSIAEIGTNASPLPWAIHAWMLSAGADEGHAKSVTRGVLALDRQWSGPFSYSSAAPVSGLPVVRGAAAAVFSGKQLVVIRQDRLDFGAQELAKLRQGALPADEMQSPKMEVEPWDVLIHRGLLALLDARCSAGVWIAADAEVSFATLAQAVSTAQLSCQSIELLVETGEPGEWRVGVVEVGLATREPKTLGAEQPVDAEIVDGDGTHLLTAHADTPAGVALSPMAQWCSEGACPKVALSLAAESP